MDLFPYQKIGVGFLAEPKHPSKAALLADEPGLGKTCQAIRAACALSAKKILIVCPASLRLNWKRELELWLTDKTLKIQPIFSGNDRIASNADILIISYDLLSYGANKLNSGLLAHGRLGAQIADRKFAVGIFDEAHYLKSRSALRTHVALGNQGIARNCMYKFFLTGTPILNRPIELYPILKVCAPSVIQPHLSHRAYAERYCGGYFDGYSFWDRGASNVEELGSRLQESGFMLRRTKETVLPELPEKTFQVVSLETNARLIKLMSEYEEADHTDHGNMGEMARIRHEIAFEKIPQCVSIIKDFLETGKQLVVFAHHRVLLMALYKEFGGSYIDGATPPQRRQHEVDQFQNGTNQIFIGQIQAAGTGITLTAASHVIFCEPSWVPGEIDQAVDRCHRIGQRSAVLAQFLVVADSLEEKMMRQLASKTRTIEKIIGD